MQGLGFFHIEYVVFSGIWISKYEGFRNYSCLYDFAIFWIAKVFFLIAESLRYNCDLRDIFSMCDLGLLMSLAPLKNLRLVHNNI